MKCINNNMNVDIGMFAGCLIYIEGFKTRQPKKKLRPVTVLYMVTVTPIFYFYF